MTKVAILCAAAVAVLTASAHAESTGAIPDPDSHRLIVENEFVKAFEIQLASGAVLPMHAHPARVVVALTPSRIKIISQDGKAQTQDQKPGDVFWYDASSQGLEVIAGAFHVIETEIKSASPPAVPYTAKDMTEIAPNLTRVVFENERVRVLDLRGEAGQQYPFHFHLPRIGIQLAPGRMKFQAKDGTLSSADFHTGVASWGNFVEHTDAVMVGSFHMVMIEMKSRERAKQ